jgi:TonB family protein
MIKRLACLSAVTLTCAPGVAPAQNDVPDVVGSYVPARAIEKPPPRYPNRNARLGLEGWVVLSYVVGTDGNVIEPMIEDSSGNEAFEEAALEMLDEWKYEPAEANGSPIEQSMTRTRVQFVLRRRSGEQPGAGSDFVRTFREIGEVIEAGDHTRANEMITDLEFAERRNLYEDAWFWWLKFQYLDAIGQGDSDEARTALRRAIGYEEDYLTPDAFVAAVERLYTLEARALDLSAAINAFERLNDSRPARRSRYYDDTVNAMLRSVDAIRALIDGPNILEVTGNIGEHGYWVHDLLRRSFSLESIDGNVEVVDLRCSRGTVRYESISAGNTWTVPESWGKCGVYIKGTQGTSFKFHEHPGA